jgi:hypothetical protein
MENEMDTFANVIEGWHDFYMMIGAAASTLVGLLFVSLSLNVEVITHEANADLRELALQTFTNFLNVIMLAVLFLIPIQDSLGLGLPLLAISGWQLYVTVRQFLKTRRVRVVPALCYLVMTIVAVSVLMGQTGSLYWLVPVMITLIIGASNNSWNLLLRLCKPTIES